MEKMRRLEIDAKSARKKQQIKNKKNKKMNYKMENKKWGWRMA